jgi:hypothetical protein
MWLRHPRRRGHAFPIAYDLSPIACFLPVYAGNHRKVFQPLFSWVCHGHPPLESVGEADPGFDVFAVRGGDLAGAGCAKATCSVDRAFPDGLEVEVWLGTGCAKSQGAGSSWTRLFWDSVPKSNKRILPVPISTKQIKTIFESCMNLFVGSAHASIRTVI